MEQIRISFANSYQKKQANVFIKKQMFLMYGTRPQALCSKHKMIIASNDSNIIGSLAFIIKENTQPFNNIITYSEEINKSSELFAEITRWVSTEKGLGARMVNFMYDYLLEEEVYDIYAILNTRTFNYANKLRNSSWKKVHGCSITMNNIADEDKNYFLNQKPFLCRSYIENKKP